MTDDPFTQAFREIAEESSKEPLSETVEWLRTFVENLNADHPTPDILILTREDEGETFGYLFHNNGLSDERMLWMLEAFRHWLFTAGDDD
jgi:hypothetical protein